MSTDTDIVAEELKPCFRCGSEPYVHEPSFRGDQYQIGCDGECTEDDGAIWVNGKTFEEARTRWHRRAPDVKPTASGFILEEVKAAIGPAWKNPRESVVSVVGRLVKAVQDGKGGFDLGAPTGSVDSGEPSITATNPDGEVVPFLNLAELVAPEPDGPLAYSSLQDFAHGMFEGADPRQGMPGWEEDEDPMTVLKGWEDIPEGHSWFRQMIVDYLWAGRDERPPNESEVAGVALIGTPPVAQEPTEPELGH